MTPEQAIENLPELITKLGEHLHEIAQEAAQTKLLWEGLGRVGGQRADHAADLLCRLRPSLTEMEEFITRVRHQINLMLANPFGKEKRNA